MPHASIAAIDYSHTKLYIFRNSKNLTYVVVHTFCSCTTRELSLQTFSTENIWISINHMNGAYSRIIFFMRFGHVAPLSLLRWFLYCDTVSIVGIQTSIIETNLIVCAAWHGT